MKLWKAGDWTRWVKKQDLDPAILDLLRADGNDREPEDEYIARFMSSLGATANAWSFEWVDEPHYWGTGTWSAGDRSITVCFTREWDRGPRFEGPGIEIDAMDAGEARKFYLYTSADLPKLKSFVQGS